MAKDQSIKDILVELQELLIKDLIVKMKSGEASHQEIKEAREMLRQNNIDSTTADQDIQTLGILTKGKASEGNVVPFAKIAEGQS